MARRATHQPTQRKFILEKSQRGVALVTGASSGIGRATVEALVQAGYRVFGTSRKKASAAPKGVTMLVCDVTDDASVDQMLNEVMSATGRIDLVVNNAGGALIGAAEESSLAQAQSLFNLNVFGIIRVTNGVLPIMRKQGKGRIVNVSSVAGFLPQPFSALYASTKHAVEGFSESLDHEVRTFGIRVALVEPAFTRTALEESAPQPDRKSQVYEQGRSGMNAIWRNAIATGDTAEEVANTVLKAATDVAPKLRYTPGKRAGQLRFMRRFVPEKAFEKSFRKEMKLPA
jgi:NAD(P)-dependent dehydrogenase (short-subunit alcohol dehydrogenase family)